MRIAISVDILIDEMRMDDKRIDGARTSIEAKKSQTFYIDAPIAPGVNAVNGRESQIKAANQFAQMLKAQVYTKDVSITPIGRDTCVARVDWVEFGIRYIFDIDPASLESCLRTFKDVKLHYDKRLDILIME